MNHSPRSLQREEPEWRPLALYAALLALSFGVCGAAYLFLPESRAPLVLEDGIIENLSVGFYLCGLVVLAIGSVRRANRFRGMTLLAALCVLGTLEEISYGQRFLPISFPQLPSGMTFDALHDSGRIVVKQFERLGVPWYVGFLLSAALLLGLAAWFLRGNLGALKNAVLAPGSVWLYVALAGGLAVAALFIDSKGFVPRKWVLAEEVLEMNAAFSLLFAAGIGITSPKGEVRHEA